MKIISQINKEEDALNVGKGLALYILMNININMNKTLLFISRGIFCFYINKSRIYFFSNKIDIYLFLIYSWYLYLVKFVINDIIIFVY